MEKIARNITKIKTYILNTMMSTKMKNLIYEFGAAVNVNDLAERNQLSRDEFKYRFRKDIGHGIH